MIGASSLCLNPLLFTMLTITTCKTYPSAPQNLIPVQTQLSDQGIPTQFLPWQETLQSQFILPLAAWDYANFYDEFTQWIKQHKNAFINPAELMYGIAIKATYVIYRIGVSMLSQPLFVLQKHLKF